MTYQEIDYGYGKQYVQYFNHTRNIAIFFRTSEFFCQNSHNSQVKGANAQGLTPRPARGNACGLSLLPRATPGGKPRRGEASPSATMLPYTPAQPTSLHFRLPPLQIIQSPSPQRSRLETLALVFVLALSFRALHTEHGAPKKNLYRRSVHKIFLQRNARGLAPCSVSFVLVPTHTHTWGTVCPWNRNCVAYKRMFFPGE